MRVALLQTAGVAGDPEATLAGLDEALDRAARAGADLLVTPEMWATGYAVGERVAAGAESADGPRAQRVAGLAARHGVAVAWGFPESTGGPAAARPWNAVQLLDRTGASVATYRKTHLYGDLDRDLFTPGDRLGVTGVLDLVDGSRVRVGLAICYDVEFPEPVRVAALAGAQILVVPTALMVPYDDVATRMVPVRASENSLPVAYVNRTGREGELTYSGLSCLVDARGTDVARAGAGEQLLIGDIEPRASDPSLARGAPYLADRRPELYADLAVAPPLGNPMRRPDAVPAAARRPARPGDRSTRRACRASRGPRPSRGCRASTRWAAPTSPCWACPSTRVSAIGRALASDPGTCGRARSCCGLEPGRGRRAVRRAAGRRRRRPRGEPLRHRGCHRADRRRGARRPRSCRPAADDRWRPHHRAARCCGCCTRPTGPSRSSISTPTSTPGTPTSARPTPTGRRSAGPARRGCSTPSGACTWASVARSTPSGTSPMTQALGFTVVRQLTRWRTSGGAGWWSG